MVVVVVVRLGQLIFKKKTKIQFSMMFVCFGISARSETTYIKRKNLMMIIDHGRSGNISSHIVSQAKPT